MYSASGLSRAVMNGATSSSDLNVSTGKIGPKISSAITADSGLTFVSTVGAM